MGSCLKLRKGKTHAVVAAVCSELRSQDDTGDEGEEGSESVEDEQNDGDGDGLYESGGHAIDPDKPAEDDGEHGIVCWWAVGGLSSEDVTDEGCEEEDPEKLEPSEDDLDDAHDGGWGVILIKWRFLEVWRGRETRV